MSNEKVAIIGIIYYPYYINIKNNKRLIPIQNPFEEFLLRWIYFCNLFW